MDRSQDNAAGDTASNTNQVNDSASGSPSDHRSQPRSSKGGIGQVTIRRNGRGWQYVYRTPRRRDGRRHDVTRAGYTTRNATEVALRSAISTAEVGS